MHIRRRILMILPVAAALMVSACGTIRIGQINADPSRYQNRNVRIEGTVMNSFGALGTGGYQVDDGTGKIIVLSGGRGVPSRGSRVSVSGNVMSGATVMGKPYGTSIRENNHKVKF